MAANRDVFAFRQSIISLPWPSFSHDRHGSCCDGCPRANARWLCRSKGWFSEKVRSCRDFCHCGGRRFSFRTNSQTTQAAAARVGYGVALLPRYLAADDPGLVRVSLGGRLPERDVWLLIRRDLAKVPRVRAVADYLVEVFRRERRLLAG